jgi:hypothetical protein
MLSIAASLARDGIAPTMPNSLVRDPEHQEKTALFLRSIPKSFRYYELDHDAFENALRAVGSTPVRLACDPDQL